MTGAADSITNHEGQVVGTGQRLADVRLEDVSKRFGDIWALRPTDLEVYRGEFFSLLGLRGSGKTTTIRIVGGFEDPTTGSVFLQGKNVTRLAPYERHVNTVFQDYALFPHMTVAENVGYGLRVKRTPRQVREERVVEALRLVRLTGFERRRPRQLSGGQRPRVALARALINQPAVLLLDEPLDALDLELRREMQAELKRIQQEVGITFIYVTRVQEEAMSMSDRVAVMHDGRIVQVGSPTDVYERPVNAFVAGFVGVSNVIEGQVIRSGAGEAEVESPGFIRLRIPSSQVTEAGPLLLTVRPEKLRMHRVDPRDGNSENLFAGRISDVSYGGAFTRYTVRGGGREMAVVEQNQGVGPSARVGEEVWLSWPFDQTIVLSNSVRLHGDV